MLKGSLKVKLSLKRILEGPPSQLLVAKCSDKDGPMHALQIFCTYSILTDLRPGPSIQVLQLVQSTFTEKSTETLMQHLKGEVP